eukprot:12769911-Alexandrium_andersonii.AAC.1
MRLLSASEGTRGGVMEGDRGQGVERWRDGVERPGAKEARGDGRSRGQGEQHQQRQQQQPTT